MSTNYVSEQNKGLKNPAFPLISFLISKDMESWEKTGQWIFSCYRYRFTYSRTNYLLTYEYRYRTQCKIDTISTVRFSPDSDSILKYMTLVYLMQTILYFFHILILKFII
jgi:hypothetical protein